MATPSGILAWRIPVDRGPWRATVLRVTKSRTRVSTHKTPSHALTTSTKCAGWGQAYPKRPQDFPRPEALMVESDGPGGADPQCREPQSPGEAAGTVVQPVPPASPAAEALKICRSRAALPKSQLELPENTLQSLRLRSLLAFPFSVMETLLSFHLVNQLLLLHTSLLQLPRVSQLSQTRGELGPSRD